MHIIAGSGHPMEIFAYEDKSQQDEIGENLGRKFYFRLNECVPRTLIRVA